jgi:nucleotide-binding universal stress UspA family protein
MYSRMVVPVDGSEPAKLALDEAIKLAGLLHASIRLLHVVDVWSLLTSEATAASYDTLFDLLRREGEQLLLDAAATTRRREYQADLIVCGTHGRRGIRRLLMGSDAEYIVRHSPVPVLLVRIPDATSATTAAVVGAA